MSADVGFDVRVYLLSGQLNASPESLALGWTVEPHKYKNIGLYYKNKFVWSFDAEGKTAKELLKQIIDYASICESFKDALRD